MKHLKTFEGFLNEGETQINETAIYVSDPQFKDETTLKADILKNIGPALSDLLKRFGINYNPITAKEKGRYIEFESKPLTGKELGVIQYGFKELWIDSFGGVSFPKINKAAGENFEFEPELWVSLHYSYTHTNGGSNGCKLILPGESYNDIFYSVIDRKFYTGNELKKERVYN